MTDVELGANATVNYNNLSNALTSGGTVIVVLADGYSVNEVKIDFPSSVCWDVCTPLCIPYVESSHPTSQWCS